MAQSTPPAAPAAAAAVEEPRFIKAVSVTFSDGRNRPDLKLSINVAGEKHRASSASGAGKFEFVQNIPWTSGDIAFRIKWKARRFFRKKILVNVSMGEHAHEETFDRNDAAHELSITVVSGPRSPSNDLIHEAKRILEDKKIMLNKHVEPFRSFFHLAKGGADAVANSHPPVKLVVSGLDAVIEACDGQKAAWEAAKSLVEDFDAFPDLRKYKPQVEKSEEIRESVKRMLNLIHASCEHFCNHTNQGYFGNLFGVAYRNQVQDFKGKFDREKSTFDRIISLETAQVVDETAKVVNETAGVVKESAQTVDNIGLTTQLDSLARKLDALSGDIAHYRSGEGNVCLEGTRSGPLGLIEDWLLNRNSPMFSKGGFWLYGNAGSGKSTLANTVAALAEKHKLCLSTFFCKRDNEYLSNPRKVLPLLAYRFAQQHAGYRDALTTFFNSGSSESVGISETADIQTQSERLFMNLLPPVANQDHDHTIVVDAADECRSSRDRGELVKALLALSQRFPWIKVFITSRAEQDITEILEAAANEDVCHSFNINEYTGTHDDIRHYIKHKGEALGLQLSDDDVNTLEVQANGLFIWCTTLFRYIEDDAVPRSAIRPFLVRTMDRPKDAFAGLYRLYDSIVASAAKNDRDKFFLRHILLLILVVSSNRPLSPRAIATFIDIDGYPNNVEYDRVAAIVERLHAVLYISSDSHGRAVRAYHASFYDFVETILARGGQDGWPTTGSMNTLVVRSSLRIMRQELRFNICHLTTPMLNKDIPDLASRIHDNISQALQYSTRFWHTHLSPQNSTDTDIEESISGLVSSPMVLFWIECLSLYDALHEGVAALERISEIFTTLITSALDIRRFLTVFSEAMESAAHIYLSALYWLPRNSLLWEIISQWFDFADMISGKREVWDATVWERTVDQRLYCIAVSPDGRSITCGADDGSIYTWNAQSGSPLSSPPRHSNAVSSVAYSPDSQLLVSGSWDRTVHVWNTLMGQMHIPTLKGHTNWVRGIAISPDGTAIASASYDMTVLRWNAHTGATMGEPLKGHNGWVKAVAYSPDGCLIASASDDTRIIFWDAASGVQSGEILRGHSDSVTAICFSPDGRHLASGSVDGTVLIWDVKFRTQVNESLRGHTEEVTSVAYSPNGRYIASGSYDCTIIVWDAEAHAALGPPLEHSNSVSGVVFLSDGRFLASSTYGGMVRVWDMVLAFAEDASPPKSDLRNAAISALAFSPDSRHLASGDGNGNVFQWDAETGILLPESLHVSDGSGRIYALNYRPQGLLAASSHHRTIHVWNVERRQAISELIGHTDNILCIVFTPDGRRLVSGADDGTVRVWDTSNGHTIAGPMTGHSERVFSVTLSPDQRIVASGSEDGTVRFWDANTRERVREAIQCAYAVHCLAFSPDGHALVCGLINGALQMWDVQTCQAIGGAIEGHSYAVSSVAYSPDGRFIASGSWEHTVRFWNVETRQPIHSPLYSHSNSVSSVVWSHDGRLFASGGNDGKVYVYDSPAVLNEDNALRRWWEYCNGMNMQSGWIRDGATGSLLLWVPVAYRRAIQSNARIFVDRGVSIEIPGVNVEEVFRYAGENWTGIYSGLSSASM